MQEKGSNFSQFTEGPFILNLKTGEENNKPVTQGRIIVGGATGSSDNLRKAIREIGSLPNGLSFTELFEHANSILNSHKLFRVDI